MTQAMAKTPKRKGKPLHVWIEGALRDAMDRSAEKSRRTLTEEVSIALEKYLETQGLWPPSGETKEEG